MRRHLPSPHACPHDFHTTMGILGLQRVSSAADPAVPLRRRLTAAHAQEKQWHEEAQQQIGCAATSLRPAPAHTSVEVVWK